MGLFSSPKPKQQVVDYFVSAHYGICHGPIDEFIGFAYGEKLVWQGSIVGRGSLGIKRGDLFGGPKVEGGLVGTLEVYPGADDQLLTVTDTQALVRNGATSTSDPAKNPAYRGIFSIFLRGNDGPEPTHSVGNDEGKGGTRRNANIGSNTAIIKQLWGRLRRRPKQCPFDTVIEVTRSDGHVMHLANPAGVIYECMVNGEWGMGISSALLDDVSFTAAADALRLEGFGLAILWHKQESVNDFIATILGHIEASLAFDPLTGTFRLRLIRDDYTIDDLPVATPENSVLETFDRSGWGETINEITVSWTNPLNEKTETVTVHDTANISVQGGALIAETRDYPGIRTPELALRVATRDLLVASSAMARAEITVNRRGWQVLPGDPVALNWPEYSFDRIPMRVTNVDYGKPGAERIKVSMVEDIFGLPEQSFVSSGGTAWVNPAVEPTPLIAARVFSPPFYTLVQKIGSVTEVAASTASEDYAAMVGTHDTPGHFNFDVVEQTTDSLGNSVWATRTTASMATKGETAGALARETTSTLVLANLTQPGVTPGALLWIGTDPATAELAQITAWDGTLEQVTLRRGVLDTVPKEWSAGTTVWVLYDSVVGLTPVDRSVGANVTLRGLPRTSLGVLDVAQASNVSAMMSGRLHRPYRPANLRFANIAWPVSEVGRKFPAALTWASRNRLTETLVISGWAEGTVTLETGVTHEVLLVAESSTGALTTFHTQDVSTATTYTIDLFATPPPVGTVYLHAGVRSLRDGLYSWQHLTHRMIITRLLAEDGTELSAEDGTPLDLEGHPWA